MSFLDQFTPGQRTALMVGVPVVGVAVIVSTMRQRAEPEPDPAEAAPPAGTIAGTTDMPNTDAIGTGTLAGWATLWSDALTGQSERIDQLEKAQASAPKPLPKYTVLTTYVRNGETANDVAIRLRAAGQRTADGRPLTAGYLIAFNQLRVNGRPLSTSQRLWPGTTIKY